MTRPGTALVTGIAGQDGIYLARLLQAAGHRVVGTVRPGGDGAQRVAAYLPGVEVVAQDLRDVAGMSDVVRRWEPDEVYNLAAFSSVGRSWAEPEVARQTNCDAVAALVDAALATQAATGREVRFFQASSAEVRGAAADSPYARAKAEAETVVRDARDHRGLHASIAILHNHESPLRSTAFVTRKITLGAAEIALGRRDHLTLGNLEVSRDWGFAGDYVVAIQEMVRGEAPSELTIGTGTAHTLEELLVSAFAAAGVADPAPYVRQDPELMRPVDAAFLVADPEPAAAALGWRASTSFKELVTHMVQVDLRRLRSGVADDPAYLDPSAA